MDLVLKWETTRGSTMTVKMIKLIRLHVTRYLCGQPLLQTNAIGLAILKDGLPKALGPWLPIIRNGPDNNTLRLLNTLLAVSRVMPAQGVVDYSSVTSAGPIESIGAVGSELKRVITDLNLHLEKPQWTKCHLSTKAGPNAQAMVGSMVDIHHLPDTLVKALAVIGGPRLLSRIRLLRENYHLKPWMEKFKIRDMSLIRKLSIIHDREGKERIIAIFDYWSQTALKPLHDSLMNMLRTIKGDCTFDQQSSTRWLKVPGPYYSLDLSAATDRFPVRLQEIVLAHLIDPEYAEAWRHVMVGYEFVVPSSSQAVKYGAGQAMGAYSSWTTFALCHHLVVRAAAMRAGYTAKWSNYCLLGDDLVLTNPKVVREYRAIMDSLGVVISDSKTHVSEHSYEFAKRWFRSGIEVSGFPFGSILEGYHKWYTLANALTEGLSRWSLSPLDVESRAWVALMILLEIRIRDLEKMKVLWHFPKKGDSFEVQCDKSYWLTRRFFAGLISCNLSRVWRRKFILQIMAEVKTALYEQGLKKVAHQLHGFNQKMVGLLPQGMDGQSALVALPYVEVVREYIPQLQESFDSLRKAYWDLDEDIVFGEITIRGIDPVRIESSRVSRMALLTKASLTNRISKWSLDYKVTRDTMLRGIEFGEERWLDSHSNAP